VFYKEVVSPSSSFNNNTSSSATTEQQQPGSGTNSRQQSPSSNNFDTNNNNSSSNAAPKTRHRSESLEDRSRYSLVLSRVRNGEDTRTTLMIRNIPNKYTQKMLLQTVDERHKGTYDFFYLPIDFKVI
jgi:hypothetical protein